MPWFCYEKTLIGRWTPVVSANAPDKVLGGRTPARLCVTEISAEDARLPLDALARIYPLPETKKEEPADDPQEPA